MISYDDRMALREYTERVNPPDYEPQEEEKEHCILCGEETEHELCEFCKENIAYTFGKLAKNYDVDEETAGAIVADFISEWKKELRANSDGVYDAICVAFEW